MKKLGFICILAILTSVNSIAQEINWVTLEKAVALQKKTPKKIIMDVYTNWCGPCKMLDKNTFQNPDVVDYVNKHYYAVKFNAEGNTTIAFNGKTYTNPNYKEELTNRRNGVHEFTYYLQVNAYPTIVYFDEVGNVLSPIKGYQNPQQIELYLKMFKEDKHKELKTQEDFNNFFTSFVPKFKG
jgi:thioredoxin-related protein